MQLVLWFLHIDLAPLLSSRIPRRSGGGCEGKERLVQCMRLISEKSRKIGYVSNPLRNVDANFNFSRARVRPTSTVSMARRICEC